MAGARHAALSVVPQLMHVQLRARTHGPHGFGACHGTVPIVSTAGSRAAFVRSVVLQSVGACVGLEKYQPREFCCCAKWSAGL
jgi:hypothetical protein